jgi:alpha-1,2-mannosyltransferase
MLGQIQSWLNCLFAASVLAYGLGRKGIAGFLIGLICLIKPQLSLFLIWVLAVLSQRTNLAARPRFNGRLS